MPLSGKREPAVPVRLYWQRDGRAVRHAVRAWLGALNRGQATVCDRGSGPGSRFFERAAHDHQPQRGHGEHDVAVFDLIDLEDLLIHQAVLLTVTAF